jgi:hypothetical protein
MKALVNAVLLRRGQRPPEGVDPNDWHGLTEEIKTALQQMPPEDRVAIHEFIFAFQAAEEHLIVSHILEPVTEPE